jgi:hypothetical protein
MEMAQSEQQRAMPFLGERQLQKLQDTMIFLETKVVGGTRRRSPGFFVMQQGALLEIA